jgi:hypothetical protein
MIVVGTADSLRSLARNLEAAVEAKSSSEQWPPCIIEPEVVSPYRDLSEFKLSFHLEGSVPSADVIPRIRSAPHPLVFLGITFLSIIGFVACIKWIFAL